MQGCILHLTITVVVFLVFHEFTLLKEIKRQQIFNGGMDSSDSYGPTAIQYILPYVVLQNARKVCHFVGIEVIERLRTPT